MAECKYLYTYGNGRLRSMQPGVLDYDDFSLYQDVDTQAFGYRFWKRTKLARGFAVQYGPLVLGFPTLEAAVAHALDAYTGRVSP